MHSILRGQPKVLASQRALSRGSKLQLHSLRDEKRCGQTMQTPVQKLIEVASSLSLAGLTACMVLMTPDEAMAQLPPGKRAVSGPELVEIVKEDFIKRKYLVTGNLTKEASDMMHGHPPLATHKHGLDC